MVTDKVIPFASVTFYVGNQTYTTTADANGKYSLKLSANEADFSKPIKAVAKGGESQTDVEFVSLLPSFNTLLAQAGSDATLDSIENLAVNITNVTTAEYALIEQNKFNLATDADLSIAQKGISEAEKLKLAALIKLVVDSADYNLPNGVNTTLDLALDKTTTTNFLATVNAKDAAIIESTINSIKNDVTLMQPSPLIGSWYFSDTTKAYPQQNHMLITFINATHYTVVMDVEDGSFNCKDGTEYGTYAWNSTTGVLTAKSIIDNNGECGVDAPVAKTYMLTSANTELVIQEPTGSKDTLTKIVDTAEIKGSWAFQVDNKIRVFVALENGHYFLANPYDTSKNFEYGTYSFNSATFEFSGKYLNTAGEFKTTFTPKNNSEAEIGAEIWRRLPFVVQNSSSSTPNKTKIVAEDGGNDRSALTSPNGGEKWKSGEQRAITWMTQFITGATVDLYVLLDDPAELIGNTSQTVGAKINSKTWQKFAAGVANTGSYNIDPAILKGSGNAYMVLVVSTSDNTKFDISDNSFSLNL